MDLTTFMILVFVYLIAIVISFYIEDKTEKTYYFVIIALGTLCFLNIYISVYYYIKLRNEPGIPGPRGPKGQRGPGGKKGKCVMNATCSFTPADADKLLYELAADKFQTSKACIKEPSLKTCSGGATEVDRIRPVNIQIKMLEDIAKQGTYTKDEFTKKINNTLGSL
jgi:hypothetical protein